MNQLIDPREKLFISSYVELKKEIELYLEKKLYILKILPYEKHGKSFFGSFQLLNDKGKILFDFTGCVLDIGNPAFFCEDETFYKFGIYQRLKKFI